MSALHEVTQSTFQTEVIESDQLVLVDFWAPWCAPCRMLAPILEKIAEAHVGRVKIVKLNSDEQPSISAQYHILNLPTLALFRDGKVVDHIVGFTPGVKGTIESMLAKHLAKA